MNERPKPFSTEWYTSSAPPPEPRKRLNPRSSKRLLSVFGWLPGERLLSVLVVTFFIFSSFWLGRPAGQAQSTGETAMENTPVASLAFDDMPVREDQQADISTDAFTVTEEEEAPIAAEVTEEGDESGPRLTLNLAEEEQVDDGSLLPNNRLLLFYGFPGDPNMGILGEYDMERLLELLREQAAAYEAADPSRPVLIAFEVIASVAQQEPQNDGSWLLDAPASLLDQYTDFAEANDILIFFDVQIGRRTVDMEVEGLRPWLEKPFVHLALDPEFAMRDDQIPGDDIGQIDGSDVTWTQNYLANLTAELGIPPKVLVVHQFTHAMIENKDTIEPVSGVQLVIDMDGWGPPDLKRGTYAAVISQEPIEFNGIKLFYRQDDPLMSPEEVLDLDPAPDLIIYQ